DSARIAAGDRARAPLCRGSHRPLSCRHRRRSGRALSRASRLRGGGCPSRLSDSRLTKEKGMRTRIACGWLVGYEQDRHVLGRAAELVFEGDRILFVGKRFEGTVDQEIDARGRLVSPGFIDTHVHSGHRASHRLIADVGRPDYFGQPFLEISVAKEGTRVGGDPPYAKPDD